MKKKNKLLVLMICAIIGIGLIPGVWAIDFRIGVMVGDELIWNCNVYQREKMEQLFGNDWDKINASVFKNLEQGAKMKWKITENGGILVS